MLASLFVKTSAKVFYNNTSSMHSSAHAIELKRWMTMLASASNAQPQPPQDSTVFQKVYTHILDNLAPQKKACFQKNVEIFLNDEVAESLVRRQKEFLISLNQQVQSDGWEGQKVTLKWFDSNKRPDGIQRLRVLLNQINQSNQEGSQPLAPTTIKQIFSQVNHLLDEKVNHRCFTRKASTAQFYSRIWQEAFQVSRLETQNDNPAATPISSMR